MLCSSTLPSCSCLSFSFLLSTAVWAICFRCTKYSENPRWGNPVQLGTELIPSLRSFLRFWGKKGGRVDEGRVPPLTDCWWGRQKQHCGAVQSERAGAASSKIFIGRFAIGGSADAVSHLHSYKLLSFPFCHLVLPHCLALMSCTVYRILAKREVLILAKGDTLIILVNMERRVQGQFHCLRGWSWCAACGVCVHTPSAWGQSITSVDACNLVSSGLQGSKKCGAN